MRASHVGHEFVEFIPNELEHATLYVSIPYATCVHLCFCGCGERVVTPLSPIDWRLTFDGESVSLDPSVGNWNLDCESHYWIECGRVRWAARWSRDKIEANRARARGAKERYYARADDAPPPRMARAARRSTWLGSFFARLRR